MNYKALFVDLDGVIRSWENQNIYDTAPYSGLPDGAIRKIAFRPDLLHPAIHGKCTHEEWMSRVSHELQREFPHADAKQSVQRFSEPVGDVNQDVLNTLRACRKIAPIYLVTNATSRLTDDLAALGIRDEFDAIFNSSEIGYAKPSDDIFLAILKAAGVQAEKSFFVDDSPKNVDAARALGFRAHLFRDARKLSAELLQIGLLGLIY